MGVLITNHAYRRYRKRVEPIGRAELNRRVKEQLDKDLVDYQDGTYIRLAGVWWVYEIKNGKTIFITCYGKSKLHLPAALKWGKKNRDKVTITGW